MCNCGNTRFKRTGYNETYQTKEEKILEGIKKKKASKKEEPVIETEALEDKPEDLEVR